jgi:phosphoribosyl 1,2-cyclic phosphate phosphodiesterase
LIGKETVLIDATPDLEGQLEREGIRRLDRIFITHWHYDHVWGLGALGEATSLAKWPPVDVYLPAEVTFHFEQELAYLRRRVNVHPVGPGDVLDLPDAAWEVVKTTHNEHSVGFVVRGPRAFAYLVDGIVPPPETVGRLKGCDLLITEATMDDLDEDHWVNFSLTQAVDFWRQTGVPECILTHLSCHGWRGKRLVAGLSEPERRAYENDRPGLRFAFDGMRVPL